MLKAFDHLFPMGGGWLHDEGERLVLKLMPAAMRGVGALHRLRRHHVDRYPQLGCLDGITRALVSDHNTFVRLLDGGGAELVK